MEDDDSVILTGSRLWRCPQPFRFDRRVTIRAWLSRADGPCCRNRDRAWVESRAARSATAVPRPYFVELLLELLEVETVLSVSNRAYVRLADYVTSHCAAGVKNSNTTVGTCGDHEAVEPSCMLARPRLCFGVRFRSHPVRGKGLSRL